MTKAEEQFAAMPETVSRETAAMKDQAPDIIISHAAGDDTVTISANEAGRELIDHYLVVCAGLPAAPLIVPGYSVKPPWKHAATDAFGFMSASKPGVHRDAIIAMTATMFAAGLVVKTKYDS